MNPGAEEPVITFPPIESISTAGWSTPLVTEERTVHIWGLSLDASLSIVEKCRSWLSEEERGRAARFIRLQDRLRFVLAHGGLRGVLARYTGLDPSALTFQVGSTGKPALLNGRTSHQSVQFSLSHSHGRMLIAVLADRDIGVDLEQIRDRVDVAKLAERFYTATERDRVIRRSGPDQIQCFYRYWVAKEAVLKGQAVGLRSLRQCEILSSDCVPKAEVQLSAGAPMQPGWTIHWIDCGSGWEGAVSAHGRDWAIRIMTETK